MRILTHNVYWFQGAPSRWGTERVAEVPEVFEALCELYESVGVDILCLQEVHKPELVASLAQKLGLSAVFHAPGGLRPNYGGAILCRRPASFKDCTREPISDPHERIHLRASSPTFELASVHLPSNRFANSAEEGDVARVRELTRVLTKTPKPNIVVGDMNCKPDSLPYQFMMDAGYVDAAVVAQSDAVLKRRVDYMWLDVEWAERLIRFEVLDEGTFCRETQGVPWKLSDHPPLLMEVR
ncbi:MAG: endonuclease/exonuclease/phosphatase family protein [Candidatus Latescibacteria bacterium]|jgi:exonuclease III|nr:endonuclease/exonuclease/phosphatase family protein [Candidatus Latescibacterota bacterium]